MQLSTGTTPSPPPGVGDREEQVTVPKREDTILEALERFLREVLRVLRPNGYFLFIDFRGRDKIEVLCKQLRCSGLETLKEERITGLSL